MKVQSFTAKKREKLSAALPSMTEGISYSLLMKLLRKKDVKVNGVRIKTDVVLNAGDKVEIYADVGVARCFDVIYKDENVIVVDKKSGRESKEVFDGIKKEYKSAGFIHRLDRNTSGVMIFSLNEKAEEELLLGFKNRTFDKKYIAEVYGNMPQKEGVLTGYLIKDADASEVKVFDVKVKGAVPIKTGYKVIDEKEAGDVLLVTLFTGKTHQIRAHLSHIGHFIMGDGKYGDNRINEKYGAKKLRLTSCSLTLFFGKDSPLYYLNGRTFSLNREV